MNKIAWILLILIPMAWGSTLPMTKSLVEDGIPSAVIVFIRFTITTFVLFPLAYKRIKLQNLETILKAFVVGVFLAFGYIFQFASTAHLSSSYIAVIGSFNIIIVPTLTLLFFKVKAHKFVLIAIPFAITGTIVAALGESGNLSLIGILLASLATLAFAIQTTINGNVNIGTSMRAFTFFMIATSAIVSGLYLFSLWLIEGPAEYTISTKSWLSIVYLSIGCTFFPFFSRQFVFKYISVSRSTLVMSSEIIFTVLFSILYGEKVMGVQWIGISFIVVAVLISQEAWKAIKGKKIKRFSSKTNRKATYI